MFSLLIGHIKLLLDPKLKLYLSLWLLGDRSKVGKGHGDVELETPVQEPEMGTSETAHCRCCTVQRYHISFLSREVTSSLVQLLPWLFLCACCIILMASIWSTIWLYFRAFLPNDSTWILICLKTGCIRPIFNRSRFSGMNPSLHLVECSRGLARAEAWESDGPWSFFRRTSGPKELHYIEFVWICTVRCQKYYTCVVLYIYIRICNPCIWSCNSA